ncbi:hypothetical protein CCUS01_04149 [Colletotrichum cuscutae]|uniref:Uncharacterized protein n=1 Tax=Colletotrichum cuscutae TaxID=1209917 RepID=A0AAI9VDL4_9PEZI|nr:hypothetical protein CCUS01_04149 [Colletotrichum cuscutae]
MAISPSFALHRPLSRALCRDLDARSARRAQEPVRQSLGQPTTAYNRQSTEAHSFTDAHFKELIPSLSWMEIHGVRPARLEVPYQRQKGNPLDTLESMAYPYEHTTEAQTL